jgi:hypothetical protein
MPLNNKHSVPEIFLKCLHVDEIVKELIELVNFPTKRP